MERGALPLTPTTHASSCSHSHKEVLICHRSATRLPVWPGCRCPASSTTSTLTPCQQCSTGVRRLPCWCCCPARSERQQALFRQQGEAFVALAFSEGPRSVVCLVTHLLLVTPVNAGAGLRSQLPRLVDCMDAYFVTLGADVTLGGALLEAAQVRVEPGVFAHGGGDWQGCAFRHRWLLEVTP